MAKESQNVADWVTKVRSLEEECGIDGVGNILQHVFSMRGQITKLEQELEEFVEISGCANKGRAKSHFRTLMRRQKNVHDLTLIGEVFQKVSSTWLDGVVGKRGIIAEPPISVRRAEVEHESMIPYVLKLHSMCEKSENGQKIITEFEQDYIKMGRTQFTTKLYKYVEHIFEVQEEEEFAEIALADVISLCKGYYPEQLLEDFINCGEALGTISATLFTLLDTAVTAGDDSAKGAVRKVLSRALHRARGGQGDPTIQEENTYSRLLSTQDNCPWGEEWVVRDYTRLANLVKQVNLEGATS